MNDLNHLESRRKVALDLIKDVFIAVESVPRERDQRKYRSQCMYWYHVYQLDGRSKSSRDEYYKYEAAIYEIKKLERKLRAWWFYEGRGITYEEALIEYEHESRDYPKFVSKKRVEHLV